MPTLARAAAPSPEVIARPQAVTMDADRTRRPQPSGTPSRSMSERRFRELDRLMRERARGELGSAV